MDLQDTMNGMQSSTLLIGEGNSIHPETVREILFRNQELQSILTEMNRFFNGYKINLLIHGPIGCGKTVISKNVNESLQGRDGTRSIYIDLRGLYTPTKFFKKLKNVLSLSSCRTTKEIKSAAQNMLDSMNGRVLLIMDGLDVMTAWSYVKMYEHFEFFLGIDNVSMINTSKYWMFKGTNYNPWTSVHYMKSYKIKEMQEIVLNITKGTVREGVLSNISLMTCASFIHDNYNGNVKMMLDILEKAIKGIENEMLFDGRTSMEMKINDIEQVIGTMNDSRTPDVSMSKEVRVPLLITIIGMMKRPTFNTIFKKFELVYESLFSNDKIPSKRTVRDSLAMLVKMGLLNKKVTSSGYGMGVKTTWSKTIDDVYLDMKIRSRLATESIKKILSRIE